MLNLFKSLIAILPFIGVFTRNLAKRTWICRGFFRDPLVCGGAFLAILFAILICGGSIIFKPINDNMGFCLAQAADSIKPATEAFMEPAKNFLGNAPETTFVQDNSIVKMSPPVAVTGQTLGSVLGLSAEDRQEVIEYTVEPGDTIGSIAEKFNISTSTVLWANNLAKGSVLKTSQSLVILPVSGVVYHVQKGDTLGAIAKTYKGKIENIVAFNGLANEDDVFIGDTLIIPDGVMPPPAQRIIPAIPLASSYFICPTAACHQSQGLHWYNAIDFNGKCGDPIYAAAAGTVQRVKYGWNGGGGNYLTILHPNGTVTYYGHLTAALVTAGQSVSQGDNIAIMGGKPGTPGAGNSTGCHVHFSVQGARNPFAR